MPIHPLVVHAAVVLVPLAALAVITMALPRWRWLARWPALLTAAGAAGSVQLAALSGDDLKRRVGDSALIRTHEMWAGRLQAATWVLFGVTVVAFWALPHVTRLVGSTNRAAPLAGRVAVLEKPLVVLLPVLAVVVLVLVVLTGDAGARAVWSGT